MVKTVLPTQGEWVWSLVGDLRSHMHMVWPNKYSLKNKMKKKKKKKKENGRIPLRQSGRQISSVYKKVKKTYAGSTACWKRMEWLLLKLKESKYKTKILYPASLSFSYIQSQVVISDEHEEPRDYYTQEPFLSPSDELTIILFCPCLNSFL